MCLFIDSFHPYMGLLAAAAFLCMGVAVPLIISKVSGNTGDEIRGQSGELAALVAEGPGRTEPVFAEPILPGTERSLFLFNVTAPRGPVAVAAWWPADAQVTCEDGVLKTTVPAAQDGTLTPPC